MSPRQPPSTDPRRGEQRPTLPPIRQLFGSELSQGVPPQQSRQPSGSPQIPLHRLALEDDRRYRPRSPDPRGHLPSSQVYPAGHGASRLSNTPYPGSTPSATQHPPGYGVHHLSQQHPQAGHVPSSQYASQAQSGHIMPSGNYPYPASQPHYASVAGPSSLRPGAEMTVERSSSSRYECSYCGKGFTRPSSLKIHINTHTGDKPYTCPFEGCGRSFSVQSNMRRHARVHERDSGSQLDAEDESQEDGEDGHEDGDKPGRST
ncbi:uncharacterized protein FIBRA_03527 [Fibroporia radiculosa]|uniref:C2H2-type domain-containing protein n=1 Tax=Fibroporia radiculosa TaxID=599839 RepID=J4G5S0_9APHY|nr:uncharacterized protein FIBRA_03527 [Fibroporia radiculosa]CCM01473.1 predicted protein [Fibroporia radiculosa]